MAEETTGGGIVGEMSRATCAGPGRYIVTQKVRGTETHAEIGPRWDETGPVDRVFSLYIGVDTPGTDEE